VGVGPTVGQGVGLAPNIRLLMELTFGARRKQDYGLNASKAGFKTSLPFDLKTSLPFDLITVF
jgi:hypothetical protein